MGQGEKPGPGGLGKIRTFVLDKLKAGFKAVFVGYRKRQLREEAEAARKAEKGDDAEASTEKDEGMDFDKDGDDGVKEEVKADDVPREEEIEVELPEEEREELERRAEAYAVGVEEAVYEKKKERAEKGGFEVKGNYR